MNASMIGKWVKTVYGDWVEIVDINENIITVDMLVMKIYRQRRQFHTTKIMWSTAH